MEIDDSQGILELNVGGQYFSTTRETLLAAGQSFFSGLISGDFGILRDSRGCVFIDRDPKLFRYVLNFLRSQCTTLAIESDSRAKLNAILTEAEFFQVSPLIDYIQQRLVDLEKQEKVVLRAVARENKQQSESASSGPIPSRNGWNAPAQGPMDGPAGLNNVPQGRGDESESDGELQDENEGPSLSQGRYDESEHADLISRAASEMDSDF